MAADVFMHEITISAGDCVVVIHREINRRFRGGIYRIEARAKDKAAFHKMRRVMGGYMPKAKWEGRERRIHTQGKMAFISEDEGGASCVHWRYDYAGAIDEALDLAWGAGN